MVEIVKKRSFWLAFAATLVCSLLGKYLALLPGLNLIGALVIALIVGMLFQVNQKLMYESAEGVSFISNKFLRLGIILLGFRLNLVTLAESGIKTILLAFVVVSFTIAVVYGFCRLFKVDKELSFLASFGCAICGAAAVMGISPQVKANKDNSVLAVAVVCIMGTIFTLVEVGLMNVLPFDKTQFGVMAGASLHEIAHAVAAGGAGGTISLDNAIIMKLSRVLLLAPAALIVGVIYQKKHQKNSTEKQKLPIPWFMLGFLITSAIGSFGPLSAGLVNTLVSLAYLCLGMAMAALGMSVNFKVIIARGRNVFLASFLGSVCLLLLAGTSAYLFF